MNKDSAYKIHFAPLQGYTDYVFRNAFDSYFGGPDVYYTPFIRAEKGGLRNKDLRDILPERNKVSHLVPQILPGTPEEFRLLADEVRKLGYREIDINLGCPFPLIAGKRKGAGMLPFPEQVRETMSVMKEYPEVRFSIKMRLGWENVKECLSLVETLNALPFAYITVHARTGKQQYKGFVQMDAFGDFYRACKHPLVYNGDLKSVEDIHRILTEYPRLEGVSLGRGLLASPFLCKEWKEEALEHEKRWMSLLAGFHEELFAGYSAYLQGESQLLNRMKSLWLYFLPATDRKLLKQIKKANNLTRYRESVKAIFTQE